MPRIHRRGEGLDALPQRRRVAVEVHERATAPRLAPHRNEIDVAGLEVVIGEGAPLGHTGIRAVHAVAPTVKRALKAPRTVPGTADEADAAVTARVLEGSDHHVVASHD